MDRRVGYLILDQEIVDDTQLSYFSSNNIEVININSMPLIQEIPADLSNEIGKRLYSFLRVIANPALEENLSRIENAVKFMSRFSFVSYEQILKLLYVKRYEVTDRELRLFSENDYARLIAFMESGDEGATDLRQLFLNAGIVSIQCIHEHKVMRFRIGELSDNALLKSEIFNLYILNKYDEIKALLNSEHIDLEANEMLFYKSIVDGFSEILKFHEEIDCSGFPIDQKVAYLHNSAVLEAIQTYFGGFDSAKVKQFVQNIAASKEREVFSGYLDIYSGNTKKRLSMYEALEKLKKDVGDRNTIHFGGTSCARLYEIKRLAITQYFFYYNNHILYQGFRDLKDFFKPYIEAIICANSDAAQKTTLFGDMEFANEKYAVEYINLDIMAKFISTKDLSALVRSYNVKQLNTGVQEVTFLAECFKNLCHSIVTAKTYGLLQSSFSALSNIVLLLNLVVLDENSKEIIAASVELSKLCSLLAFPHNFEFVHQIVGGEKFFEYAVNVHFNSLRHLIEQFISKDEATTDKIQAIIDTTEDFHKKVILLRLFYQQITGDTVQQKYKYILSDNFAQLPIEAIYDFIFSGWLTPDQNSIKEFLNGVIELSRKEVTGVHSYPDPVESRLECVYLLYINDMISDISALKELSEGRPHLQFLLDSESFDYSQVDFSNYMWENFARHEKYMSCFIAHKDAIIPIIQNRIKSEEASETEKRILYGFLLSGNEIWKI